MPGCDLQKWTFRYCWSRCSSFPTSRIKKLHDILWCITASTRKLLSTCQTAAFQSLMWPVDDIFVPPVVITVLCHDTISARTVVGHLLLLARLPGTHWATICVIRRLALTVSDVFSRVVCFQSTSTSSALEVLHSMCYINLRLIYLLTYNVPLK